MKIYAQTAFSPVLTVYDSKLPDTSGNMGTIAKAILRPVIKVTDDSGTPIYSTGEFYTPWLMYATIGLGTLLLINVFDKRK
jgi:hypothetical protein